MPEGSPEQTLPVSAEAASLNPRQTWKIQCLFASHRHDLRPLYGGETPPEVKFTAEEEQDWQDCQGEINAYIDTHPIRLGKLTLGKKPYLPFLEQYGAGLLTLYRSYCPPANLRNLAKAIFKTELKLRHADHSLARRGGWQLLKDVLTVACQGNINHNFWGLREEEIKTFFYPPNKEEPGKALL